MDRPDHVSHWPPRHQADPRCHSVGCGETDPSLLRWYTSGLACEQHRPQRTYVPQPQLEIAHVPQPIRLPTGRHRLPRKRRAKRS